MKYGIIYWYSTDNGNDWIEFTDIVQTPTLKIEQFLCSTEFKSAIDTCSFTIPEITSPIKQQLLSVLVDNSVDVLIKIVKEIDNTVLFFGVVDRSSISVTSTSLPSKIDITCRDLTFLFLDKKIDQEYVFFGKKVSYIVNYLINASGMQAQGGETAIASVLNANGDDYELMAFAIDKDDGDTYRSYIDTLLFECGGYVLNCLPNRNLEVRRLPWDAIANNSTFQGFRDVDNYISKTGVSTKSNILKEDGVKVKWSTVKETEDNNQQVYNAQINLTDTEDGTWKNGVIVPPKGFFPVDGDVSPAWFEYESSFLDKPYLLKDSRKQNKDLSIIATRNHSLNITAWKSNGEQMPMDDWQPFPVVVNEDLVEMGVTNNPQFLNKKAFAVVQNNYSVEYKPSFMGNTGKRKPTWRVKDDGEIDLHVFNIRARVTYRDKINTLYLPSDCREPKEYTSTYIYDKNHAIKFSRFYWNFLRTSRYITTWSELNGGNLAEIVRLSHKGSNFNQYGLVVSKSLTFLSPKTMSVALTSVGLDAIEPYNPEVDPQPTPGSANSSKNIPGLSSSKSLSRDGQDGKDGTEVEVQYALGTSEKPTLKAPFVFGKLMDGLKAFYIGKKEKALGDYGVRWEDQVPNQDDENLILWQRQTVDGVSQQMRVSGSKGDFGNVGKICFVPNLDGNVLYVGTYDSHGNMSNDNTTIINGLTITIEGSRRNGLPFMVGGNEGNRVSFVACVQDSDALDAPIRPRLIKPVVVNTVEQGVEKQKLIWCLQNNAAPVASDGIVEDYIKFVLGEFKPMNLAYKIYDTPISLKDASTNNFMQLLATENMDNINTLSTAMGFDAVFERLAVLEAFVNKLYANQITLMSGGSIQSQDFPKPTDIINANANASGKGFWLDADGNFVAKNIYVDGGTFKQIRISDNSEFIGDIIAKDANQVTYFATQKASDLGSATLNLSFVKDWWFESDLYSKLTSGGNQPNVLRQASGTYNGATITHVMAYSNANVYRAIHSQTLNNYQEQSFVMPFSGSVYIEFQSPYEHDYNSGYWQSHSSSGSGRVVPSVEDEPSWPSAGETYITRVYNVEEIRANYFSWDYDYDEWIGETEEYDYLSYTLKVDNSVKQSNDGFSVSLNVNVGQTIRVVPDRTLSYPPDGSGYFRVSAKFSTTGVKLIKQDGAIEHIESNKWYNGNINITVNGTTSTTANLAKRWSVVGANPFSAIDGLLSNIAYELASGSTFMGVVAKYLRKESANKIQVSLGNGETYTVETNPTSGNDLGSLSGTDASMTTQGQMLGVQTANIMPSANEAYDIGRAECRFQDLYVETIHVKNPIQYN